jgi:hypothetical protein
MPCSLPTEGDYRIVALCNGSHDNVYTKQNEGSHQTLYIILTLISVIIISIVCCIVPRNIKCKQRILAWRERIEALFPHKVQYSQRNQSDRNSERVLLESPGESSGVETDGV